MRNWLGVICVFLGIVCLLSAVGMAVYNRREDENAEEIAQEILADVKTIIEEPQVTAPLPEATEPPETTEKLPVEMATVKVEGYDCIGVISVPVLELELPVLTEWSYAKLKKAPCHYYGTYYDKNFVIAAHNYTSHFGRLSKLRAGDLVVFTDVNGKDYCYEVVLLETLPEEATREMITSGFDLSLYTCTLGGESRVTVRCNRLSGVAAS